MIPENQRCYSGTKAEYSDCTCTEFTLYFHNCQCGARDRAFTEIAKNDIIPNLTEDQEAALVAYVGIVEERTVNRLGYGLKKLGLLHGISRSGDGADVLTDLGVIVQNILREHWRVMNRLSD